MRDAASDRYRLRRFIHALERGNPGDIDQEIGLHQAQIQHRPEGLAARQEFDRGVFAARSRHSGGKIGRTHVVETNRLNLWLRPACAIACNTCRGVIGETRSSARNGRKASLTALMIAAGGAIPPPSPSPFTPNSVCGASVSMWSMRGAGTSVGPGSK